MEYIKKNYEKIILSLVLLAMVGVLVLMWFVISADKQKMEERKLTYLGGKAQPLPDLDMTQEDAAMTRLQSPLQLDFSSTNKLFNPVQWVKTPGGIVKQTGLGPHAAVVTKITPLYYSISLDSVMTNALGARYVIVIENQAAALPALRHGQRHYISVGEKLNNLFTLTAIKGPADDPSELDLKLADTGESIVVLKNQPYKRLAGYTADLKYDPEKLNVTAQRVGDHIFFSGDDYKIIAIDENQVILMAQSNQQKYTLPYGP